MLNLECCKSKRAVCSHEVASATDRSLARGILASVYVCVWERERSLHKPGLHNTLARELAKYELDLVGLC